MRKEFDDADAFDDEQESFGRAPVLPNAVRIAGIIWIVIGVLLWVNAFITIAMTSGAGAGRIADAGGGACAAILPIIFGIAFIMVGNQSLKGTAKDTLGNAIGSIVLGLAPLAIGVIAMIGGLALAANAGPEFLLVLLAGVINTVVGIGLETAGILAIVGRSEYRAWRRWQKGRLRDGES